jgi:hypothetical protein
MTLQTFTSSFFPTATSKFDSAASVALENFDLCESAENSRKLALWGGIFGRSD